MANISWGQDLNKYTAYLRSRSKKIQNDGERIAQDAAEFGARKMQEFIETRGTGYVGRGPRATPEGRIDTGYMYDQVGVSAPRRTATGVAINFGWVKDVEDYFALQERGFKNVPPMHALLDASVQAREYFYQRIKEIV